MAVRVRQVAVACVLCVFLFSCLRWTRPSEDRWQTGPPAVFVSEDAPFVAKDACITPQINKEPTIEEWDTSKVVRGPPTSSFRDNLKKDLFYITSWSNAGFTNQFMSYVNMIYLGIISNRIPIVPPFAPDHHISRDAGALPFGRIFNMSRLRESIRKPVLEWSDVKLLPSETSVQLPLENEVERIGCWSTRHEDDPHPLASETVVHNLRLDVSYTRAPNEARWNPQDPMDDFLILPSLVPYIAPGVVTRDRPLMAQSRYGTKLPPETHMTCFDYLYFTTTSRQQYEWEHSWCPPWRFVGKHLHFTDEILSIARGYLTRVFDVNDATNIPPFIGVHVRHGDFAAPDCQRNSPKCYTPLNAFKSKVEELKADLLAKQGVTVDEVILFSDDTTTDFWDRIAELGWRSIDHSAEKTFETYGEWYPPIIEVVIQSMSIGFIGSRSSTFSLVSAKRVEDWNQGIAWMI